MMQHVFVHVLFYIDQFDSIFTKVHCVKNKIVQTLFFFINKKGTTLAMKHAYNLLRKKSLQ